jgi:acid phosphatase
MRRFTQIVSAVILTLLLRSIAPAEVNLLTMGDWGSAAKPQQEVAAELSDYVQKSGHKFDAMLLAGDNFYTALASTADPMWHTLFEDMYDPAVLNFPFYAALGNHDYQNGKAEIERAYARENPLSRWSQCSCSTAIGR